MRIVHLIDYFHTDVGYQEYYLAKFQAKSGNDVRVVTSALRHHALSRPEPSEAAGRTDLLRVGVELVRLPAIQLGHDRAWLRGLPATVLGFRPDVVHAHNPFAPSTVRIARTCRAAGVPLLVDSHIQVSGAPAASRLLGRVAYHTYRLLFGAYLRRVVGDWVADAPLKASFLASNLAVPPSNIPLVPLGFDPEVFRFDEPRRATLRAQRGWSGDLVVTMTGKLTRAKRADLVALACEKARARAPVRFVIAGTIDEGHLEEVRGAAPTLTEADRLEVLPFLDRGGLCDLYLAADVVVFPRLTSISIFEAAGTGVRVLLGKDESSEWTASLHPGIRSVVPEALDAHFEADPDRATQARRARQAFSWPVISGAFVQRYEALVAGGSDER